MKKLMLVAMVLGVSNFSFGQSYLKDKVGVSETTTVAGAVSIGSGYKAYKAFSTATQLEKQYTQILIEHTGVGKFFSNNEILEKTQNLQPGDEVSFKYHLNEAKNRAAWVSEYQSQASSARSSASSLRAQAMTAAVADPQLIIKDGKTKIVYRPNPMKAMLLNSQASQADARAIKLDMRALEVKQGAQVPWMEFEASFYDNKSSQKIIQKQMMELLDDGGKIFSMKRLPKTIADQVSKHNLAGTINIFVSLAAIGGGIYNHVTGDADEFISDISMDRIFGKDTDHELSSVEQEDVGSHKE